MESRADYTWINQKMPDHKAKLDHVRLDNKNEISRSVRKRDTDLTRELRLIGAELQKLLDRSQRLLVKKWAFYASPPHGARQTRFNLSFDSSAQNLHGTITPNVIRPKSEDTYCRQYRTSSGEHINPEFYMRRNHFAQTGQHNSVRSRSSGVRFSQPDHTLLKQLGENTPPDEQSLMFEHSKRTSNGPPYQKTSTYTPHKKASLKMIAHQNKPVDCSMNEGTKPKDTALHHGDGNKQPTNDKCRFLDKFILELNESEREPNGLNKTTVQIQFRNPSTGSLNTQNTQIGQMPVDNRPAAKETQRLMEVRNKGSDTSDVDHKGLHDTRIDSNLYNKAEPLHGRKREPSIKNSTYNSRSSKLLAQKIAPHPRSQSYSRRTTKSNDPPNSCKCAQRRRGLANWYEPVVCSCDYEQEANKLTGNVSRASHSNLQRRVLPALEQILPELDDDETFDDNAILPNNENQMDSSTKPTLKRSISLDTLEMLQAVEQPTVLDSISNRRLEREIRRGKSSVRAAEKQNQTKAITPVISPKLVSSPPVAQPSPHQTTTDHTSSAPTTRPMTVVCCPFIQPPCFPIQPNSIQPALLTDICAPAVTSVSAIVQSSPMSVLSMQQLCPPPPVYGACLMPSLSPTMLQQTVFLPSSFHLLSYPHL